MPFALKLRDSLQDRHSQVAMEFAAGESLETVLGRHLLAVEASADSELLTSILLLDESGTRILHGAAPSLPEEYCTAINGAEIGPKAGSCGTAAYTGRATYVTDIATDPLWDDYRHIALPHGLRACWSTPIRDSAENLIGTFAVYHPTRRSPTSAEVDAIRLITGHVADVISWYRSVWSRNAPESIAPPAHLRLVRDPHLRDTNGENAKPHKAGAAGRLDGYAAKLDRYAELVASAKFAAALKGAAIDCRKIADALRARRMSHRDDR